MRGMGKGVRSFRQGMAEVEDEIKKPLSEADEANAERERGKNE